MLPEELPIGLYQLEEIKAPNGYLLAQSAKPFRNGNNESYHPVHSLPLFLFPEYYRYCFLRFRLVIDLQVEQLEKDSLVAILDVDENGKAEGTLTQEGTYYLKEICVFVRFTFTISISCKVTS